MADSGIMNTTKWRILAGIRRLRRKYGPYIRWKEDLIKRLVTGSSLARTGKGPIEYKIYGDSGPFLSVMHGGPGGYDQTAAIFSDMLDKGFRILSWSRPGYIRTPLDVGRAFEDQSDAFALLLDVLGIERTAVLGYSAGGPPALCFAARYPGRIRALILECAVSRRYVLNHNNLREKIFFSHLMFNDPALWVTNVIGRHDPALIGRSAIKMESSLDEDEVRRLMHEVMHDERRVKILMSLMKSMSPAELRKKGLDNDMEHLARIDGLPLKYVRTPTLVIHGTNDADVPLEHAGKLAREISGAELYLVEEGFHILALSDNSEKITGKRIAFLKEHAPR
jgi:pimeloyl-ACP methyl ester carboxylesterase